MADTIYPGNATPADVRTGKTFSAGSDYDTAGSLADNGNGSTITPGTANQTIAAGIWDSANTVLGDANLVPASIVSGQTIFGVVGTGHPTATGSVTSSASTSTFALSANGYPGTSLYSVTVSGLSFTPVVVILWNSLNATDITICDKNAQFVYLYESEIYNVGSSDGIQLVSPAQLVAGGFTLPVNKASTSYQWAAYGS